MADKVHLFRAFNRLKEALLEAGEYDLADQVEDILNPLRLYELLPPTSFLLTVTGPQGTGKSTLVNTLLNLKPEEALYTGYERAERVPVILLHFDKKHEDFRSLKDKPVKVYQIVKSQDTISFSREDLTYEEGRERSTKPKGEDFVILWYIYDNPVLKRFSPIAVMPGFELMAEWAEVVLNILRISDVVLYVLGAP